MADKGKKSKDKKSKDDKDKKKSKKTDQSSSKKKSSKPNLQERSAVWKAARPFLLGGVGGSSATCCIQPVDMVKVRIQLQGEGTGKDVITNPLKIATRIISEEGVLGLYKGLSAAVLRQCTYGLTRFGLYRTITNKVTPEGQTAADIPFSKKLMASLCAGCVAGLIGTPSDAALVRMQSDATLPIDQRRGYTNVFNALFRMAKEEGLKGFFSGATPTIFRGLLINVGMLSTYDSCKKWVGDYLGGYESQPTRFVGGAFSGWVAATVSLPADFVKTRLQKMKPGPDGSVPYKGLFDCITKTAKNEGLMAFYQGYPTFVVRIAPHIMLTWVFADNYKALLDNMNM